MGKSGGKKKKPTEIPANNSNTNNNINGLIKKANELKEEGNKRFQAKDFIGALEKYENGLKLIPKNNKERAIFHSNRAACLMEMKPIDYHRVVSECDLAVQYDLFFVRALLRRAKAYEALGRFDLAMSDVEAILRVEPGHSDALEICRRIRSVLLPASRPSPAALGASAVRGAPVAGLGPSLPARPVPKKVPISNANGNSNKNEKVQTGVVVENGHHDVKGLMPKVVLKPDSGSSKVDEKIVVKPDSGVARKGVIRWRQLKLVYDHDIRLAQMPVNCGFKNLREIVGGRFPSSKSVLIKYKDSDGDLVTITSTSELKLAEACADGDKVDSVGMLRLHVVEVDPEQEPAVVEEEEVAIETKEVTIDETHEIDSRSSLGDTVVDSNEVKADKSEDKAVDEIHKEKKEPLEGGECKEVEMDDWLFEFAQLFRNNVGIDPDVHIELHEVGMELCSEALEETVTSEEAQPLFEKAAQKFQEVAALAYFNWGNVHMCEARKRIPVEENGPEDVKAAQLQIAYHLVNEKYSLAREKYEQALSVKPDFYEGLLALAQQQFEMAKLQWSYVLAKKTDLSSWDSSEIFKLFDSAQEKMKRATEMWEKIEEQRANELKDPTSKKTEELLKRKKKLNDGESVGKVPAEPTPEEQAEQAAVMRSQIHLFWGNMLFERSQIEFRLGVVVWKKNLDTAVGRFKLAGASQSDISTVTSNHCSVADVTSGDAKKANNVAQGV